MKNKIKKCLKPLIGVITPISWDKNGNAKKFSLYTQNDEDIMLVDPSYLQKFKGLLRKIVKIEGEIITKEGIRNFINIKQLKVFRKAEIGLFCMQKTKINNCNGGL